MTHDPTSRRAVVADDHLLMRQGVTAVLAAIGIEVVAECASKPDLLAAVDEHLPDLVVTDIRMPPTSTTEGIDAAREIRAAHPSTGIVVLSQHADAEYVTALFADGSDRLAYLLKDNVGNLDEVRRAVSSVCAGGSTIDPEVVGVLVAERTARPSPIDDLTDREREVLALIAEGWNNGAIAERLVIAEKSVHKHINTIFAKLHLGDDPDAHRRVRAVRLWLAAGR